MCVLNGISENIKVLLLEGTLANITCPMRSIKEGKGLAQSHSVRSWHSKVSNLGLQVPIYL